SSRWLDRFGVPALLAGASGLLFFGNLGRGSLQDWDEATYAEIAREIGVFHDWIHLHWNYLPWFNKAPLYIWLTAPLYTFGVNAFWARAVSALAGVGVILLSYAIGKRLYGRPVGVGSAIVLGSCYPFGRATSGVVWRQPWRLLCRGTSPATFNTAQRSLTSTSATWWSGGLDSPSKDTPATP